MKDPDTEILGNCGHVMSPLSYAMRLHFLRVYHNALDTCQNEETELHTTIKMFRHYL